MISDVMKYREQNETLTGRRVKCINMDDIDPVAPGEKGTVRCVDDMGTVHVEWDNGRRIGLVPDGDKYELLV